jgi:EmrB/QacA subfamily drug resistance transporter
MNLNMNSALKSNTKWWILIITSLSLFLTCIDITAVNLILAPISSKLHIPVSQTQWIINAYLLIYAAVIIAGGRLGDILGEKKILIIGFIGFLIGSCIAASAYTFYVIIIGRIIQGISAALISPNALALVYRIFPQGKKGMITGVISSIIGVSIVIGPLLGGLLTNLYSWRLVFLINVPIGLAVICLTMIFISPPKKQKISIKQLDLFGVFFLGMFLFCFVAIIDLINEIHQEYYLFAILIAIAVVSFILFIYVEKHAENPLMNITLLENKVITICCLLRFLFGMPTTILTFIFALYLQQGLGYSVLQAGMMFLPLTCAMMILAPYVGKLADRIDHIIPLNIGITLCIVSYLGFALTSSNTPSCSLMLLFAFIAGLGLCFARTGLVTAIMKATPDAHLGLVNSVFNMMNLLGGSIGIAIAGTILSIFSSKGAKTSLIISFPLVMYFCIGILILILALIHFGLRVAKEAPEI